jgi:hypothetical protein
MVRKNSPQLKALADSFLKEHRKGTAFGNELLQRYRTRPRSVLPATSGVELRKFQQTVELFRKYGSKYDLAYQLVAAAEQERAAARQTLDAGSP